MSGGSSAVPIEVLIIFVMLMLYIVLGTFMEHKNAKFGHETGIALVAGLIVSAIVHYVVPKESRQDYELSFDGNIFFYVCLPPIIFAAGFNMQRRRFFENIFYILLFGVIGTIVTFFIFSGLTYLSTMNGLYAYNNSDVVTGDRWFTFVLMPIEAFLISSLLCSSDVIAAISIVKYED